jgi:hypothetical protein
MRLERALFALIDNMMPHPNWRATTNGLFHTGIHGIGQQTPIPRIQLVNTGMVQRRKVLGGIINDYYRTSGNTPVYLN